MFTLFKKKDLQENVALEISFTSLLIHAARIDENYSEKEREIVKKTLLKLGVDDNNINNIINKAEIAEENSNQILEFTKKLKNLEEKKKLILIEALWSIIYSDKDADIYEANLMRRISGLLSKYLSNNTIEWVNPGIPPLPDVVEVTVDESHMVKPVRWPLISILCGFIALGVLISIFKAGESRRGKIWFVVVLAMAAVVSYSTKTALPGFSGRQALAEDEADRVFDTLHTNLFRAFDYKTEDDVYDALARTTDGNLLRKIYLDMRKSLEVQEQGGAVSNIDRIEILEGDLVENPPEEAGLDAPDFAYRCTWELEGTVEHWGHIHQRTNRYEALFNVQNVDGVWKFTDFQSINQDQGQVVRSLRKF